MKNKTLEEFFGDYAIASMSQDEIKVAEFYAQNFIAAAKDQSSVFTNDHKFNEWLKGVFKYNKEVGLKEMKVKNIEAASLGKYFYKATVTWSAVFAQKPDEEISFDIHYILNRTESSYKIVMYISEEDQEELMKEKGLLK